MILLDLRLPKIGGLEVLRQIKMSEQLKHIPVVVVGGQPEAKNLLVAFDGSRGAMKGVVCIGALTGTSPWSRCCPR